MRSLKLTLVLSVIGIVVLCFQSGVSSQSQDKTTKPKPDVFTLGCSVADPIDECIQELFSKADFRFGMTRVPTRISHIKYFAPSNAKEEEAVRELEASGWDVGFYLAGRQILGDKPDLLAISVYADKHPVIGGPISITGSAQKAPDNSKPVVMPDPAELWDEGQKAMRAFKSSNRYEFSIGKWNVEARPIRAREGCLKCHSNKPASADVIGFDMTPSKAPIKIGDALGVAMYAYAKKP